MDRALASRPTARAVGRLTKPPLSSFLTLVAFAVGFAACSVDSAKNHYVLAEKLWTDQKYAAAVSEFEKVTVRDPQGKLGLQALFRGAMTQALFLSEYGEAVRKLKRYAEISSDAPSVWEAQTQIGEILFSKTEQYDQTIQHYFTLLKQYPTASEAPEFLYRIGKSQFYLWQFDEALLTYQKIQKTHPKSTWAERAMYEVGVTYFTRGEQRPQGQAKGMESYRAAIQAHEAFLKKYPQSELIPLAKFGIASCLEEMDQLDEAYEAYEELRKTYPSPNVIEVKLVRIRERKAQRSR